MNAKPELFRVRHFSVRNASQEDLLATQPVYHVGQGKLGKMGILCLHGFTGTPASFYEYNRVFIDIGYSVSTPLLPGHGTTPQDLSPIKWPQWLDCAIEAYDNLRRECDKIFVIGFSLGGSLALHLASIKDDVAKLFLLSPAIKPGLGFKFYEYLFIFLTPINIQYWFQVAGDVKNPEGYEIAYKRTPINSFRELSDCFQQTQNILPKVCTDAIIFQSKTDREIDPKGAEMVYQRINSRNKEIVWLDNSYHAITQDYCGKEVLDRILREISLA